MDLFLKLKSEFEKNLQKNDKILACVSGGPDSVVLIDFLNKLKEEKKLKIYIAHFNHKLRGKDSEKDADFVKNLAIKYGNKFLYKEMDIKKLIKLKNSGPEKTARDERYKFFIKAAQKNKILKIFLAHNKDDNVETILFRFIKGAGTEGLTGIPRMRKILNGDFGLKLKNTNIYIIRPLLKISRKEILEYIKENKLKYMIDKTNKENIYVRNKIRNKLIPFIEKVFNPNFKNTVVNISDILSNDNDFLEDLCKNYEKKIILKKSGLKVIISFKNYIRLNIAIRLRLIRNILKFMFTKHRKITYVLIQDMDRAILNKKNISLPFGYKCYFDKRKIIIKK